VSLVCSLCLSMCVSPICGINEHGARVAGSVESHEAARPIGFVLVSNEVDIKVSHVVNLKISIDAVSKNERGFIPKSLFMHDCAFARRAMHPQKTRALKVDIKVLTISHVVSGVPLHQDSIAIPQRLV
jgi:hypothetical protein